MSLRNIIIINDFGSVNGGSSEVAINTTLSFAQQNYQIYFFYAVPPLDENLVRNSNIHSISTNQFDILRNPNRISAIIQGLWNRRSAILLGDLLSTLSPKETIIHVHSWTKALSHSLLYKARFKGFPIIITLHDYFLACPNGGFYNYQTQQVCKLKGLSLNCFYTNCDSRSYSQKLWRFIRGSIQKYIAKIPSRIKYFITVSNKSREIISSYLPHDSQIYSLPNPIETKKAPRVDVQKNKKFFAIGRLSPEKGFDLLAKASRELGIDIVFIGDGELKRDLEKINPNALFLGWLSRDKLQEKMKEARALVFCSKWYETQGLVISEAASFGIPAIVSDITCGSESIIDNLTGLLYKNNDLSDLKNKILMLQDDQLIDNMSKNAYNNFWASPPLKEEYAKCLEKIYTDVLTDHNNNR